MHKCPKSLICRPFFCWVGNTSPSRDEMSYTLASYLTPPIPCGAWGWSELLRQVKVITCAKAEFPSEVMLGLLYKIHFKNSYKSWKKCTNSFKYITYWRLGKATYRYNISWIFKDWICQIQPCYQSGDSYHIKLLTIISKLIILESTQNQQK